MVKTLCIRAKVIVGWISMLALLDGLWHGSKPSQAAGVCRCFLSKISHALEEYGRGGRAPTASCACRTPNGL